MFLKAKVDRDEALSYVGYAGQEIDEQLSMRIDEAVAACEAELRAQGVYRVFAIASNDGECVTLENVPLVLPGRSFARQVKGAARVALMACTLGAESERALRRHAAVGTVEGLLFSAAASSLVESAADALNRLIEDEAAACGWSCARRFSPGYGDMPLSAQRPFLEALDATRAIGLVADDGGFLLPMKSITAAVGLFEGDGASGGRAGEPCAAKVLDGLAADAGDSAGYSERVAGELCDECARRDGCALLLQGRTCHGVR